MKKILKKPLKFILKVLAKRILKKFNPDVIAVTGSVGKTSTKDAIYEVLKSKFLVNKNKGSYNNEIGIPLTILGFEPSSSFFIWGKNLFLACWKILFSRNYWQKIILEMGADHVGDIKYLTSFIKPKISIITKVSPAHLEFFGSLENIAKEKGELVEAVDKEGWVVLNGDDQWVRKMKERARGQVIFYGLNDDNDIRASNIEAKLGGISFKLHYKGSVVPVHLKSLGRHHVYAALAAICCGIIYEMDLVEISKALENYKPPVGRVNLLRGIKDSIIINDTYNSNPESVSAAVETLDDIKKEFPKSRRVVVLGDMLELGDQKKELHEKIGEKLVGNADVVFLIGELSRHTFEKIRNNFLGSSFWFADAKEATEIIKKEIKENDIILVKGSRGMRMERIAEALKE